MSNHAKIIYDKVKGFISHSDLTLSTTKSIDFNGGPVK